MRQGPNSRRSRGRGNNNNSNNNPNRRSNLPNRNQTFDSNGPDIRIRGNAHQVAEKYMALARDASAAGDRVMAENYLQHAEHYQRIINAINEAYNQQQQQQQLDTPREDNRDGDQFGDREFGGREFGDREAGGREVNGREVNGRDYNRQARDNGGRHDNGNGRDGGGRDGGGRDVAGRDTGNRDNGRDQLPRDRGAAGSENAERGAQQRPAPQADDLFEDPRQFDNRDQRFAGQREPRGNGPGEFRRNGRDMQGQQERREPRESREPTSNPPRDRAAHGGDSEDSALPDFVRRDFRRPDAGGESGVGPQPTVIEPVEAAPPSAGADSDGIAPPRRRAGRPRKLPAADAASDAVPDSASDPGPESGND